jgi:hypothetical protein
MRLIDPEHPVWRPVWVRLAVVGGCLAWAGFEVFMGSPGWALLFAAAGIYAAIMLFGKGRSDV